MFWKIISTYSKKINFGNQGFALVMVLFVCLLLTTFFSSLILYLIQDIKMTEYNYHYRQAAYNAEAAFVDARALIDDKNQVTEKMLDDIEGKNGDFGTYEVVEVLIKKKGKETTYYIRFVGRSGNVTKYNNKRYTEQDNN
ncbi:MAG: hypothetical protein ACOCQ1_01560 [Halanaerobiaceae bacterium]